MAYGTFSLKWYHVTPTDCGTWNILLKMVPCHTKQLVYGTFSLPWYHATPTGSGIWTFSLKWYHVTPTDCVIWDILLKMVSCHTNILWHMGQSPKNGTMSQQQTVVYGTLSLKWYHGTPKDCIYEFLKLLIMYFFIFF